MPNKRTTIYKEASINYESSGLLLITRYPSSYGFEIRDDGGGLAYIEIGPNQIKRLIKNLTLALEHNKHI